MKERFSLTPGSPRFTTRRLENPEDKVSSEEHETYRSGVGTLLYLTNTQQTRHLQSSETIVQNHGCTSTSASEGNVQGNKTCAFYKRILTEI